MSQPEAAVSIEPGPLQVLTTVEIATRQAAVSTVTTPADLLRMAVEGGADLDRLERLMAMKERWDAAEAKRAFNEAFASFKAEAIQIVKTKKITDGPLKGKLHADLAVIVESVTPALSRHGLSVSWKLTKDERDWLEITCTLSHAAGHSESVSMGGAPDTGPGRNAIQARGSAVSYLERYTLIAMLGLAARDQDDDGRGGKVSGPDITDLLVGLGACRTSADAHAYWIKERDPLRGTPAYDQFKAAVSAHRTSLLGIRP